MTTETRTSSAVVSDEEIFSAHEGGKLGIGLTSPIKSQRDLSIAYTPGVARVSCAIADDPEWDCRTNR